MGITEDRDQKQIYFCAFCNGMGVIHLEHGTRICQRCHDHFIVRLGKKFVRNKSKHKGQKGKWVGTVRVSNAPSLNNENSKKRWRLYDQQEKQCYYCGLIIPFEDWTVDHLRPLSKGGSRIASNEVGACSDCNGLKANMTEEEFRASSQFPSSSASSPTPQPLANHS